MPNFNILILDYSTDNSESAVVRKWLPDSVTTLYIDTEASFPEDLDQQSYTHVIHTGSALSINEPAPFTQRAIRFIRSIRDQGIPQMGICYGHQLVCLALVGPSAVRRSPNGPEVGWKSVTFCDSTIKIPGTSSCETIWQFHYDEVMELPEGSELLATNDHTSIQAHVNSKQRLLGTQFHPEFNKTDGNQVFAKERKEIESHGFDVDAMLQQGPSLEAGKIFFRFFLDEL